MLQSKLHVPALRSNALGRTRLVSRLVGASQVSLTLVAAPAGLRQDDAAERVVVGGVGHRAGSRLGVARPGRQRPDVVLDLRPRGARDRRAEAVRAAQGLLQSGAPQQAMLHALLNGLQTLDRTVHLVLDDYHVVEDETVHEGLTLLLDHLPAQAHVVLSTGSILRCTWPACGREGSWSRCGGGPALHR
jgi:LuxR family maltose regulon positive regulatory protein